MSSIERCDECGFDGSAWTDREAVAEIRVLADRWAEATDGLPSVAAARRPIEGMWSVGEYVDHVREVLFGMRFVLGVAVEQPGTDLGSPPDNEFSAEPRLIDLPVTLNRLAEEATELAAALAALAPGLLGRSGSVRRGGSRRPLDLSPRGPRRDASPARCRPSQKSCSAREAFVVSAQDPGEPIQLAAGAVGLVTDIHANPYALEAVLDHGATSGVEKWLVLGDVVAMGPEPGRVLDQLAEVDVIAFIAGNTERYVLTGDRPDPSFAAVAADPGLLPRLTEVAGSFAWTKGYLQATGQLDQLRTYRSSVRFRFPDQTKCLAVHASLVADDGQGIAPDVDATEMAELFAGAAAEIVFGGHTHVATDLTYSGTRFVNPGSISNHHEPHLDASYSIVRLSEDDHRVEQHSVGYDKQLAVESIQTSGIPGSGFLLRRYFNTVDS